MSLNVVNILLPISAFRLLLSVTFYYFGTIVHLKGAYYDHHPTSSLYFLFPLFHNKKYACSDFVLGCYWFHWHSGTSLPTVKKYGDYNKIFIRQQTAFGRSGEDHVRVSYTRNLMEIMVTIIWSYKIRKSELVLLNPS